MAILYGIEIKKRKETIGHEGEVVYFGDLYLNEQFVGKWQEDRMGVSLTYDFDIDVIKESVKKYV